MIDNVVIAVALESALAQAHRDTGAAAIAVVEPPSQGVQCPRRSRNTDPVTVESVVLPDPADRERIGAFQSDRPGLVELVASPSGYRVPVDFDQRGVRREQLVM